MFPIPTILISCLFTDMERMITQASTTAHGTTITCSIVLTVTALGLALIMNAVTVA